jgi:hypothetical protein
MRKRYIYSLLFGIPGLFIAGFIAILVFAAFAGVLWIFIFGDNPWPAASQSIISILFVGTFLVLWAGFILLGYSVGKRLENASGFNRTHIAISAGLTLLFILFMVLYQWRVGNIGPRSDSVMCSDFCTQHGYAGSGMPPATSGSRICSCYDDSGNEVLTIPLDHLDFMGPE